MTRRKVQRFGQAAVAASESAVLAAYRFRRVLYLPALAFCAVGALATAISILTGGKS